MQWIRWVALLAALVFLGCGQNGAVETDPGDTDTLSWDVPAVPSPSPESGGLNNQPPPPELWKPVFVPRNRVPRQEISHLEKQKHTDNAVALVKDFMKSKKLGTDGNVAVQRFLVDEYGGVHVRMRQTHDGVPVLGGSAIAHIYPDMPSEITDGFIEGISVSTTPSIPEFDAEAIAESKYAETSGGSDSEVELFLAVRPELQMKLVGPDEDEALDYERELTGSKLVWVVLVAPPLPDFDAAVTAAITNTTPNEDPDGPDLQAERAENTTHGGNEEPAPTVDEHLEAITTAAVEYMIDAQTGEILAERSLEEHAGELQPAKGTGYGYFVGQVELDTAFCEDTDRYFLIDKHRPSKGPGNVVWDARNLKTYDTNLMELFADVNNSWGDGSILNAEEFDSPTRRQTPAVDVAFGIQMTWDFLQNVLGRDGIDGEGGSVRAAVHFDEKYADARHAGDRGFIVFGDGKTNDVPGNYSLTTVGHELGHALWRALGIRADSGEARALNEGHADILGSLAHLYRSTGNGSGPLVRHVRGLATWKNRLRNPLLYSQKNDEGEEVIGFPYWSPHIEDFPEHVGGLPMGRAFIYLAEGAPSDGADGLWTFRYPDGLGGIGVTNAANIWYQALMYHTGETPSYASMRLAFLQAAAWLYPGNVMVRNAVKRAFHAIRVGEGAPDQLDPQFTYAHLFDVNLKDMTALALAFIHDDTGRRALRIKGHDNKGYYDGDFLAGYVNIARAPIGTTEFEFEIEDSAGKQTTTTRTLLKARNRNLIRNGDFENGMTHWSSTQGGHARFNERLSFIGSGFLEMSDSDTVYQEVTIPASAQNVCLVYRLLTRDTTRQSDSMTVRILSTSNALLRLLENHTASSSRDGRNWLNKGYIRYEHDLSDFAGQTIRVAFVNNTLDNWRFRVDQVVMTYEEDVFVDVPDVDLAPWENTVGFRLLTVQGINAAEIGQVVYYVDGVPTVVSREAQYDWFAGIHLDRLGPGIHWVGAVVLGHDGQRLAQTLAYWWRADPFNELLTNGQFESALWPPAHTDPPPRVDVASNTLDSSIAFDGDRAMKMGGQGVTGVARAGQVVSIPTQIRSLEFSCRLRLESQLPGDGDNDDEIKLEIWNASTLQLIESYWIGSGTDKARPGRRSAFSNYWRREIAFDHLGRFTGKSILVILRVDEDSDNATTVYFDNVSLRYTEFPLADN